VAVTDVPVLLMGEKGTGERTLLPVSFVNSAHDIKTFH